MKWNQIVTALVLSGLMIFTSSSALAKNNYVDPSERGPDDEHDPYEQHEVDGNEEVEEAYDYIYKEDVDPHHNWRVKLSNAIHPDSIHNVVVVDSEENLIDVSVELESARTIKVNAPDNGYEPGEVYWLIVDGLYSKSYQHLKKVTYVEFAIATFEEEPIDDEIGNEANGDDMLTAAEQELANLINAYRVQTGLHALPISKSLTHVARLHVQDSIVYSPENSYDARGQKCNLHSWSANGPWSTVCYTSDHKYATNMWNKPSELTSYKGYGYEISVGWWSSTATNSLTPAQAINSWKNSPGHNAVIIGQGSWSGLMTMGVAIDGNYAHVWFGKEPDPAGYY